MRLSVTAILFVFLYLTMGQASEVKTERQSAYTLSTNLFPVTEERQETKGERSLFIRIFKLPAVLEIWTRSNDRYTLSKSYPICSFSGFLGPKRLEGDRQSPEGIYTINAQRLNPKSKYHLSFDIGFPNLYDTSQGYTGSSIMVHGGCSSSGCFAMTDKGIEEIYAAVEEAFREGQQTIPIHIFPFALTSENLQDFSRSPWIDFWRSLAPIYGYFESNKQVPMVFLDNNRYSQQPVGIPVALSPLNFLHGL